MHYTLYWGKPEVPSVTDMSAIQKHTIVIFKCFLYFSN